jgi:ribosome maturation factor RimP
MAAAPVNQGRRFYCRKDEVLRAYKDIEQRILDAIEPEAEGMGLEIVRVRLTGGRTPTLQLMVEKTEGGTDVEHCADFSRAISPLLDVFDPVSGNYHLEVSTPGIDRPLTRAKDFTRWQGHLAKVELKMPVETGQRRFTGELTGEDDGTIRLLLDDESELECTIDDIAKASLVLTEELIAAAKAEGTLAPQPGDEDFEGLETDEGEEPESTEEEEKS